MANRRVIVTDFHGETTTSQYDHTGPRRDDHLPGRQFAELHVYLLREDRRGD